MTDDENRTPAETDWLAHTRDGYGYGYTKRQALLAVAPYMDDHETLPVDLVEHVGDVRTGLFGWEVDELVSRETIEITGEDIERLRQTANTSQNTAERVLDRAGRIERD